MVVAYQQDCSENPAQLVKSLANLAGCCGNLQDPAQKPMSLEARDAIADSAGLQSVSSWGLDRINQVDLPLDNTYSSGDFDGRGVHGETRTFSGMLHGHSTGHDMFSCAIVHIRWTPVPDSYSSTSIALTA